MDVNVLTDRHCYRLVTQAILRKENPPDLQVFQRANQKKDNIHDKLKGGRSLRKGLLDGKVQKQVLLFLCSPKKLGC